MASPLTPGFGPSSTFRRNTFTGAPNLHGIPGSRYPSANQVAGWRRQHPVPVSFATHPQRTNRAFIDNTRSHLAANRAVNISSRP